MATTDAATPLNAEPSQTDERETLGLKPKSYVDAVLEDPAKVVHEPANGSEGRDGMHGGNGASQIEHTDDDSTNSNQDSSTQQNINAQEDTNGEEHTKMEGGEEKEGGDEKALERVESNGEATNGMETPAQQERPGVERQESQHEYSATGLDESRSPPRYRHKKTASQKSNTTNPTTGPKNTVFFEKFQDQRNGAKLVTVKATGNYEKEETRADREALKVDTESRTLVSGRQAGKGWERSGIRFAPMNVPLQRRLQTLVVLFHSTCIALSVSAFFFLCAIPIFWPLLIIYMIYCLSSNAATSGSLKYRSNFLRSLRVWSLFASYFPARLHRSQELPPTRKYIFGYHPHGIISHGAFAAFSTEALGFSQLFPGITNTLLTLDSNFRIPIYRDYILAMGLASVSRESCENLLSKGGKNKEGMGRAITIVVGGARESLDAQPYSMRLVLKRRKGFVKMALRTGADLVPVLAFGENDLYDQVTSNSHPSIHKAQLLVKKILGFTIPLFHARGVFNYDVGLMPYRRPLNIVVGRPIKVTQSAMPKQEELDELHEKYVQELESIWDSWKDNFAKDRQGELEILE